MMPFAARIAIILLTAEIACAQQPLLRPSDRVAIVGGSFVERMQSTGALEAELHCRRPDWRLSVRNLGWSGDDVHGIARKVFDEAEQGYERLLRDIDTADPNVVVIAYGSAEASNGSRAVSRFRQGLLRLVTDMTAARRRTILLAPVAMPGYQVTDYGELIRQCREVVRTVGAQANVPVVESDWRPSDGELDGQRLFPNEQGYRQFARRVADALVGGRSCETPHTELSDRIARKNELFFHHYRPQNETYLFLFRKHEQGNNASEIPMFVPLIKQADEAIWKAAASSRQAASDR